MKTTPRKTGPAAASVLLMTLGVVVILSIIIGGYLALVRTQNASVARSQAWNYALALAEAGVEEALAQLNSKGLSTNTLAGNGWTLSGGMYRPSPAQRDLQGGRYSVSYTPGAPPTIYSTGYTAVPAISAKLVRAMEVKTTNAALFPVGMIAVTNIDAKGGGIATDSYDSSLGAYASQPHGTNGDVASTYGWVNAQNATIKGWVLTGPNGGVTANSGTYLGWRNDFNMDFPEVLAPFTSALPLPASPPTGPTLVGNGNWIVNGNYKSGDLDVTGKPAVLYITGNLTGNPNITIEPGASLLLYVGGANTTLGRVTNTTPANFQYYGLPGNTSITLNGNDLFAGTIYAPNAAFTAAGGGNNNLDILGALVVKSATLNGHFNFHYDISLRLNGPMKGYVATSWREL